MPQSKVVSVEDEAYLTAISAEPKMTMDEVGADIETHGHVPVTPETATQDPFTSKGSLSYALDEALSADTDLGKEPPFTKHDDDRQDSRLNDPTDDFRDETKGEVEGTTDTPQNLLHPFPSNKVNGDLEPMIQQDKADNSTHVKDSLVEALDSIAMDANPETPLPKGNEEMKGYSEETASVIPQKVPDIPESLGGDPNKADGNGLVYVTATFTVDPEKYVSNNYRPIPQGNPDIKNAAKAGKAKPNAKGAASPADGKGAVDPEAEEEMSDLGTPEARESAQESDEPTAKEEEQAAREANKEQNEETDGESGKGIPKDKEAQDEAPEKVVLDYATFIDGSSFMCFDEVAGIDYTKIVMDAGVKKTPTRENCETTFAQCRAKNPLFCRFHGPKLLEADIKTAIKATVGSGCVVSVTKDKGAKNKFTFRLTVGCPPSKKKMVEKMVHMYLTQNPGISSSTEDWNLAGKHKQTMEFEMDILRADKPPEKNDLKGKKAVIQTRKDKAANKVQGVVKETDASLEKKASKGEKWQTVDEPTEKEWADTVDNTVNKTLLANNSEFMSAFEDIANQFDEAHDKGDANGLKQALEALKGEIGKYDLKTGEKLAGAEGGETAQGEVAPQEEAAQTAEPEGAEQPTNEVPPTEEAPQTAQEQQTEQAAQTAQTEQAQVEKPQETVLKAPTRKPRAKKVKPQAEQPQETAQGQAEVAEPVEEQPKAEEPQPTEQPTQKEEVAETVPARKSNEPVASKSSKGLSEADYNSAAMAIANSGEDVFDDAFAGLAAIIKGEVQGFGAMSSEEMTRDMADRYIDALSKDGGNHKAMIEALKNAVNALSDNGGEKTEESSGSSTKPSRPSENEFQSAAMEIANSGDDVYDDAFAGLAAIVDGKVQGFGSMSSEEMTREMAERYKGILEKNGEKHKGMIGALDRALSSLSEKPTKRNASNVIPPLPDTVTHKAASLGTEGIQTASMVQSAQGEAKEAEAVAKEIGERVKKFKDSGENETIARIAGAIAAEAAHTTSENAQVDAREGEESLKKQEEDNRIKAEKAAKGKASDRVEKAVKDMTAIVFADKNMVATTVPEAADALISDLGILAESNGMEGYAPQSEKEMNEERDNLKYLSAAMDSLGEQLKEAMGKRGADFQPEDIEMLSERMAKIATRISAGYTYLKGLADKERSSIETAAQLKKQKAELEAAKKQKGGNIADYAQRFSYAAYGEEPNRDPETMDVETGGSGDIFGSQLLQFAANYGGILKMPKGMAEYLVAKGRYDKAKGKSYMTMKKPTMKQFGVNDPLADYIDGILDGGVTKNKGVFRLLFGDSPAVGGNDEKPDLVPPELEKYIKETPLEQICNRLIEAQADYRKWKSRAMDAYRTGKAEQDYRNGKTITLDEIEERDKADAEYDNALAEVLRYGPDSNEVKYFSKENMKDFRKGDVIRFDHADEQWHCEGYDADNDILTVTSWGTSDNPQIGEQKFQYRVSEHGFEEIPYSETEVEVSETPKQEEKKGKEEDGLKDERGTAEVVSRNEGGETSGTKGGVEEAESGEGGEREEPEPFSLESVTAEQETNERKKRKEKAAIKKGQEAELHGSAGEVGQSLFDFGGLEGEDLFNRTVRNEETDKSKEEPKSEAPKKEGSKASTGSRADTDKQIAQLYKDWVEEPIPDWVKNLSDDEASEYLGLLDAAANNTADDSNAFNRLTAWEDEHSKAKPKPKEEEPKKTGNGETAPSGKRDGNGEAAKPLVSAKGVQETKIDKGQLMQAIKRVGLDAFKPEDQLKRLLNEARHFMSGNPRMAQKAKDIELILADRAAKKEQAEKGRNTKDWGRYTGVDTEAEDEMPKSALRGDKCMGMVLEALVKALEG